MRRVPLGRDRAVSRRLRPRGVSDRRTRVQTERDDRVRVHASFRYRVRQVRVPEERFLREGRGRFKTRAGTSRRGRVRHSPLQRGRSRLLPDARPRRSGEGRVDDARRRRQRIVRRGGDVRVQEDFFRDTTAVLDTVLQGYHRRVDATRARRRHGDELRRGSKCGRGISGSDERVGRFRRVSEDHRRRSRHHTVHG